MSRDQEADVVLGELRRKVSLVRSGLEDVERRLAQKDVSTSLLLAAARGLSGDVMQVLELAGEYKGLTGGTQDIDGKKISGARAARYVIGFEGGANGDVPLTYGAAAFLVDDDTVVNAVSRATCDCARWRELVDESMATSLCHPWQVTEEETKQPCYVLRVRKADADVLRIVMETMGADALRSWRSIGEPFHYWLFASLGDLHKHAEEAARLLRTGTSPGILAIARTLDPYDGMGKEEYLRRLRVGRPASSFLGPAPDPDTLLPVTSYRRP